MSGDSVAKGRVQAPRKEVFVFGSNLAGRHGAGAALDARRLYGAVTGEGHGHYGNSYAIPTKDVGLKTLSLRTIQSYVDMFIGYAKERQDIDFMVTAVGCGLAGYKPSQIAHFFAPCTYLGNVYLPEEFAEYIGNDRVSFDRKGSRLKEPPR